ncbi:uncharacterized protein LOC119295157 [Triticum dicoccoides]|uniref:uncharacterized protein LOC119295157 n=1 Tax=Triticum dicoccoides TaxID=85692 RepID=UPI00188FF86A|nr:uncharacterized protein LOC119295157 [Triticum dicoccoides]
MRSMMWRFYQRCYFQVRFCVILYRSLQHATLLLHGKGSESGGFDGDWLPAACLYVWKAVVHGRPVSGGGWARPHDGWKVGFVAFSLGHHRTTISAHLESRMKRLIPERRTSLRARAHQLHAGRSKRLCSCLRGRRRDSLCSDLWCVGSAARWDSESFSVTELLTAYLLERQRGVNFPSPQIFLVSSN